MDASGGTAPYVVLGQCHGHNCEDCCAVMDAEYLRGCRMYVLKRGSLSRQ